MDKRFKSWLINISEKIVKDTYDDIKNNDKLLFAKLGYIVFACANGDFEGMKAAHKVKRIDEEKLIDYVNSEVHDVEIKSIDDICNVFENDISDMDNFFFAYCLYNGHDIIDVWNENLRVGSIDGVFETLPKPSKIDALSNVTKDKISPDLSSIYTKEHLTNIWNTLTEEEKFSAIKSIC